MSCKPSLCLAVAGVCRPWLFVSFMWLSVIKCMSCKFCYIPSQMVWIPLMRGCDVYDWWLRRSCAIVCWIHHSSRKTLDVILLCDCVWFAVLKWACLQQCFMSPIHPCCRLLLISSWLCSYVIAKVHIYTVNLLQSFDTVGWVTWKTSSSL